MTTQTCVHAENYRAHRYTVYCDPSVTRLNRWNVWIEIFDSVGAKEHSLVLSAEHAYSFTSYEDGKAAGICFAQQLIDSELLQ